MALGLAGLEVTTGGSTWSLVAAGSGQVSKQMSRVKAGCVAQPPTAGGAQLCSPDIMSVLEENKKTMK